LAILTRQTEALENIANTLAKIDSSAKRVHTPEPPIKGPEPVKQPEPPPPPPPAEVMILWHDSDIVRHWLVTEIKSKLPLANVSHAKYSENPKKADLYFIVNSPHTSRPDVSEKTATILLDKTLEGNVMWIFVFNAYTASSPEKMDIALGGGLLLNTKQAHAEALQFYVDYKNVALRTAFQNTTNLLLLDKALQMFKSAFDARPPITQSSETIPKELAVQNKIMENGPPGLKKFSIKIGDTKFSKFTTMLAELLHQNRLSYDKNAGFSVMCADDENANADVVIVLRNTEKPYTKGKCIVLSHKSSSQNSNAFIDASDATFLVSAINRFLSY